MFALPIFPIFTRPARPSRWNWAHLAGPMEDLTQREWEQGVMLCSLAEPEWRLLDRALDRPASLACRRFQASISHWRPCVDGAFAHAPLKRRREFLRKELAAIWYLLDTPALACTGFARNMLLVEHGKYLRLLLQSFAGEPGAGSARREVAEALADLEKRKGRRTIRKEALYDAAAAS